MEKNKELREANLIGHDEQNLRLAPLRKAMAEAGIAAALICNNANLFWLTGRVFRGYVFVAADNDQVLYLVRRPNFLTGNGVLFISKPAEIPAKLAEAGVTLDKPIALELGTMPYSDVIRLCKALELTAPAADISPLIRSARAVKTEEEQNQMRLSGEKHTLVYKNIPHYYREGMTDVEFQIEIERASRLEGCLGQFRVAGTEMEIFMGNVLTGANADTPSPYDFAMGGAGTNPSLPAGADGTVIRRGNPVMIDINGNYTGYMTDMTRCFISGDASEKVQLANRLSIDICEALRQMMVPGTPASSLYEKAAQMAREAGMDEYFMGHRSKAGFVGHGVGIEINELPVIAPRSRDILQKGNTIALEPKFVLPGIGAIGVENTYIVHDNAPAEILTRAPQNIVQLD